jgi:hypothetical protein
MKKILFSLLFSFIAFSAAQAQFGIKGGISLGTMAQEGAGYSRSDVESKSIIGPVVGITYEMNIADIISIQPELLYTQLGSKNKYDLLGSNLENNYRINYLELPVLAKVKFGNMDRESMGFYIAAGPWLGYALNGKQKVISTGLLNTTTERDFTFDDEDDAKRLNYGMIGAAGVTFGRAALDLRYNYGFNNLLDADANNNNDNKPVLQTRGIALTLGYSF